MEIINIHNWTNEQVLLWFRGLEDNLQRYELHLKSARVVGAQLLNLSYDDLYNLRINQIGHQELILDAVSLLQQLDYGLDSETLQSRALCLKCRCRGLRSSVAAQRKEAEEYEYAGGVSLQRGAANQLLRLASDVLDEAKQLILWLDRSPFNSKHVFRSTRDKLVKLCYELSVTMQQSVFACVIEDAASNICIELENSADGIVQSSDPLIIQPVSIEQIHLHDINPHEGLGLFIKATFEGHHVVTGTRVGSVAARARRITQGDEVIGVNGRAVVGWTLSSLVAALKEQPHDVALLMKKRPQLLRSLSSSNLLSGLHRNEADRAKIFRVATPIKRTQDQSQPTRRLPSNSAEPSTNGRPSTGTWSTHRSHDPADDMSSERMSTASVSDKSDRCSATNESRVSTWKTSHSSSTERSNTRPTPLLQVTSDPSSPIDLLKFPPPPPEPYSPKSDCLAVQPVVNNSAINRAASPNSLLDIEHQRRYTVIGGSTVDQQWYDNFISHVNKQRPSNNRISREKISSGEDVFTPSSQSFPHPHGSVKYREQVGRPARPVSMPPNYLCSGLNPSKVVGNYKLNDQCNFSHSKKRSTARKVAALGGVPQSSNQQYYYNRNNSSNNVKASQATSSSGKTPPKPPPRSSSINKLNHRLSAEVMMSVEHSRQSSLPEKTFLSVAVGDKPSTAKPSIARKPTGIHISKKALLAKSRSKSTPHLQQATNQHPQVAPNPSPSEQGLRDPSHRDVSSNHELSSHGSQHTSSSTDSYSPRPVPKPRKSVKRLSGKKLSDPDRERSSSHGNLIEVQRGYNRVSAERRKSADPVPRKLTVEHGRQLSPSRYQPTRSSPTRLSYTTAIHKENASIPIEEGRLRTNDVPQPNDNYEVRVIAGVPVRLRKSLTRLAGSRLKLSKSSPDEAKPNSSPEMKGERRVSCRDLGKGDCEGWLWKKKSGEDLVNNGPLTSKWSKRWVVIKERAVYCYREDSTTSNQRAESFISLPGYAVTPAPECKRKFAFRITHVKRKTFFFAAERQMDMSRWMNKMGLASIGYKYETGQSIDSNLVDKDNDYYSESDNDDDDDEETAASTSRTSSESNSPIKQEHAGASPIKQEHVGASPIKQEHAGASPIKQEHAGASPIKQEHAGASPIKQEHAGASPIKQEHAGDERSEVPNLPLQASTQSTPSFRRKSDLMEDEDHNITRDDVTPSGGAPDEVSVRGNLLNRKTVKLSKSLSSLLVRNPSTSSNYERARERASKWAARVKRKVSSASSRASTSSPSSLTSPPDSPSSATSDQPRMISSRPVQLSLSEPVIPQSPPQDNKLTGNNGIVTSRPAARSEPPTSSIHPPPHGQIDSLNNLRQSIKKAEVDLLGANRRITLRRKMTILAPDPQVNERMLRKRALERELKAKELELAYYDKLLNKEKISRADLHSWINQHPSLFAELGTLRRMSKNKRPLVDRNMPIDIPPDGSDGSRSSDSSFASIMEMGKHERFSIASNNSNANNNRFQLGRGGRPRSSAIGSTSALVPSQDSMELDWDQTNAKSQTLPLKSTSQQRRRKLISSRPLPSHTDPGKPYLETDL